MNMKIEHGGGLTFAMSYYGGRVEDWLDLSTGINPESLSFPAIPEYIWNRLPDTYLLEEMLEAARTFYNVPAKQPLVAAPGTQSLIQLLPFLREKGQVAIVSPTYQEYSFCFLRAGWNVAECKTIADIPPEATIVIIVNPNNPDGRCYQAIELLAVARKLNEKNGLLIIDEAFCEAENSQSLTGFADEVPIIVLKSFGKYFGLAGLRLGFAFADQETVNEIDKWLGPWAVSGPALFIAKYAFSRSAKEMADFEARIQARRQKLAAVLRRCGLNEIGGSSLFTLVRHAKAAKIYEELARKHILVRKFDYASDWLRIGLCKEEADLVRFEQALNAILNQ